MKEFNKLLKFRDYYEYDFDCEVIRVMDGALHDEAKALYSHFIKDFFMKDTDKWAFDIALDCVHNFTDDECEIIQRQGEIFDYHFGYGMYVRNRYVHPSKLHSYYMADNVSSAVAGYIYTILLPVYNCLSEEFMKLISDFDFDHIEKDYRETQPIIGQTLEELAVWSHNTTANEALEKIKQTIRSNLGPNGFKDIILPIVREHVSKHKYINVEWKDLADQLYRKTRVYSKEYNQLKAIKEMLVISKMSGSYPSIKSTEEACAYIIKELGLSEPDAKHMAECAAEIAKIEDEFSPPLDVAELFRKVTNQGEQK